MNRNPTPMWLRLLAGLTALILILGAVAYQSDEPAEIMTLGLGVIGALIVGAVVNRLVGKLFLPTTRSRAKPAPDPVVKVAVDKPISAAPSLSKAYRAVPGYAARLLKQDRE